MATPSPTPLAPGGTRPSPALPPPHHGATVSSPEARWETRRDAGISQQQEHLREYGKPRKAQLHRPARQQRQGIPRTTEEATEQAYTEQSQQSLTMDTYFDPSASEMDRITFLKAFLLDHSVEWRQRDAGWLARSYAERCRDIYRIICVWMKSTEVVLGNYFTSQQYLPFCEMLWSERCFRDVANETSTTISARYLAIEFIFVLQRALVRHDERNQKLFLSATPRVVCRLLDNTFTDICTLLSLKDYYEKINQLLKTKKQLFFVILYLRYLDPTHPLLHTADIILAENNTKKRGASEGEAADPFQFIVDEGIKAVNAKKRAKLMNNSKEQEIEIG